MEAGASGMSARKRKQRRKVSRHGVAGDKSADGDGRVVRDSFTMPGQEHARLKALKVRCLERGVAVKKSELLRAGVRALDQMGDRELLERLERLQPVKTGRPRKRS